MEAQGMTLSVSLRVILYIMLLSATKQQYD